MRWKWSHMAVVGAAVVVLCTVPWWNQSVKGGAAYAAEQQAADQHVISVSGHGEIQVDPDVAYVNVGVVTEADTAKEAQAKNAEAFSQMKDVLSKQYGVSDKDILTTDFEVQPQYQYNNNEKPKITGYSAVHNVKVTYRKLDSLGNLLDALSGAGANRINGVQFSTEKADDYKLQALDKAMANAKTKADRLAKIAGSDVKGVLAIQENGASTPPVTYNSYAGAKMMAADSAASTSIQAGQLTISADVSVQYGF